ncbi:MAG: hypothetical protein K6G56_04750 [Clostridiales bacterium]|nr:hypothetical protein [Clostridiales bacterium]
MKKSGWTKEETELLFGLAESSKAEGGSLTEVFHRVAELTGRRPDSVRNRYYAGLSELGIPSARYVPFTGESSKQLIIGMLKLISRGYSVRKAALELADGDVSLMLRFQNKYRSLLTRSPELVEQTARENSLLPALSRAKRRTCSRKAEKAPAADAELACELKLRHEQLVLLEAMARKLCELDSELVSRAVLGDDLPAAQGE